MNSDEWKVRWNYLLLIYKTEATWIIKNYLFYFQVDISKLNLNVETITNWVKAHDEEKKNLNQEHLVIEPFLKESIQLTTMLRKYFKRLMVKNLIKLGQNDKGEDILSWKSM